MSLTWLKIFIFLYYLSKVIIISNTYHDISDLNFYLKKKFKLNFIIKFDKYQIFLKMAYDPTLMHT